MPSDAEDQRRRSASEQRRDGIGALLGALGHVVRDERFGKIELGDPGGDAADAAPRQTIQEEGETEDRQESERRAQDPRCRLGELFVARPVQQPLGA